MDLIPIVDWTVAAALVGSAIGYVSWKLHQGKLDQAPLNPIED